MPKTIEYVTEKSESGSHQKLRHLSASWSLSSSKSLNLRNAFVNRTPRCNTPPKKQKNKCNNVFTTGTWTWTVRVILQWLTARFSSSPRDRRCGFSTAPHSHVISWNKSFTQQYYVQPHCHARSRVMFYTAPAVCSDVRLAFSISWFATGQRFCCNNVPGGFVFYFALHKINLSNPFRIFSAAG